MRARILPGVLLLIATLAFACKRSSNETSGGPTKVKVQLNWVPEPEFGGLYAARDGGAYKKAGLDVEIAPGGAGSPVVQLVAAGQVDFGVAGADDVVIARARGVDIVAIFATYQSSPLGVMVHASRNIEKLEQLTSGTLAIEPGLPFGAWLKKKYGFAGVTLVPYDGGIAKFLTDTNYAQQVYVTSEPIAAKKKGASTKVFSAGETGFDPYTNVLITRGAMLKEKMPTVKAFVTASAEGWRAYLADPSSANATMGKLNTSMDEDTFAQAAAAQKPLIENEETNKNGLGSMREERWTALAAQLVDLKLIPTAPKASDCYVHPK